MPKGRQNKSKRKGWYGQSAEHARVGSEGGRRTAEEYGPAFYSEIGRKGGRKKGKKNMRSSSSTEEKMNEDKGGWLSGEDDSEF